MTHYPPRYKAEQKLSVLFSSTLWAAWDSVSSFVPGFDGRKLAEVVYPLKWKKVILNHWKVGVSHSVMINSLQPYVL